MAVILSMGCLEKACQFFSACAFAVEWTDCTLYKTFHCKALELHLSLFAENFQDTSTKNGQILDEIMYFIYEIM